jgi:hypothetical protein
MGKMGKKELSYNFISMRELQEGGFKRQIV